MKSGFGRDRSREKKNEKRCVHANNGKKNIAL